MATDVDDVEGKLKSSKEHVQLFEGRVAEQSNQLLTRDSAVTEFKEQVTGLEKEVTCLSAIVKR